MTPSSLAVGSRQEWLLRSTPVVFVLIWSTGFIVARYGMPHAPPMTFLAWRFVISLLLFGLWIRLAGLTWPVGRQQWLHLSVCGVLLHAAYLGGVWAAVKLGMSSGTSALIVGLQPLLTAGWMSWVSAGPALRFRQWAGLALGLCGLFLVVWEKLNVGEASAQALALAVFALLSITVGTIYQKRYVVSADVRTSNFVQLLAASVITVPLAMLEPQAMNWNVQLVGALAWSVVVLTLGGSSLLFMLVQKGVATRVVSLMYLVPPCTAVMAWFLFGETLTWSVIVGMTLTAWGVWWVMSSPVSQGG
jgi:drug/metabolite transporter (DMT)-like permease